jgi:hypothetical protein
MKPFIKAMRTTLRPSFRGASATREPGIHTPQFVFMDSGLPRYAASGMTLKSEQWVRL